MLCIALHLALALRLAMCMRSSLPSSFSLLTDDAVRFTEAPTVYGT